MSLRVNTKYNACMRYFIGIGLPYDLQEHVGRLRSHWEHFHLPNIRFPHGVQPHITIKSPFETDRTDWLPAIEKLCKSATSFTITLTGIDAFDSKVVHVQVTSPELGDLNQQATGILRDLGIDDDADLYAYTPHSTIGYAQHTLSDKELEAIRASASLELNLPQAFIARKIQIFQREEHEELYEITEEFELLLP